MMNSRIVPVASENLAEAAFVYCESWRVSHLDVCSETFIRKHNIEYQTKYLQSKMDEGWELYLYRALQQAVGIVGLNRTTGEVGLLYILPDNWHMGYGRTLLSFALATMNKEPVPFLSVISTHARAVGIYEKFGFVYSGERKEISAEKGIYELKYYYRQAE